jgi:hypothetical protein
LIGPNEQSFPGGPLSDSKVFHCVCGGSIFAYYDGILQSGKVISHVDITSGAGLDRLLYSSEAVVERWTSETTQNPGGFTDQATDLIKIPFGSVSRYPPGLGATSRDVSYSSLKGTRIEYPASWGAPTITALENLISASVLYHSAYGRGIYLGTPDEAFSMPMLLPGSGHNLFHILDGLNILVEEDATPPPYFPDQPGEPIFADSNRRFYPSDKGGPLAYSFYGVLINPADNDFRGRAVLQISGGPPMAWFNESDVSDKTVATALDAFWPTHRPVLKKK